MSNENKDILADLIGKKVVIRDHLAGVFITTLTDVRGRQWTGAISRKIHYWDGAGAIEGVAETGVNLKTSRLTVQVEHSNGQDLIQICPVPDKVYIELMGAQIWNPK